MCGNNREAVVRYLCFGALLLLISVTQAEAGGRELIGVGAESCGTWIEANKLSPPPTRSPLVLQLRAWILGFVSGVNNGIEAEGELFGGDDGNGLIAYIDKYCADNPLDTVGNASNHLAGDLFIRGVASGKLKLKSTKP
jgi:hypothetical protein